MMQSWLKALGGVFLAALWCGSARAATPPQPGTLNYIEGKASIGGQALTDKSVGSVQLAAGQTLSTQDGRAEILLTPGVFFRLDAHSAVRMDNPGLADTIVTLEHGRALVEVAEIHPENNVRVNEGAASVQLRKDGLYEFDTNQNQVRVFDGKALVQTNGHQVTVKGGRQVVLAAGGNLKARKFDRNADEGDFYRWASLRSSYLAEANVDVARAYAGGSSWLPGNWYGAGWYWDPWFSAYTFVPGDGIFYGPFGWSFYSPWYAYGAPYFGYAYGFGSYHRFGPGYSPFYRGGDHDRGFFGRSRGFHGGAFGGFSVGGRRGGFHGRSGGFGRGGSGGFHGGGFHGGGGRR